ncbi:hypothetical protein MMC25_006086 [Agyrium rufum]|nr:hypothetical protein [Agyrium rufum]
MSAAAGRVAGKVGQAASNVAKKAADSGTTSKQDNVLKKGARRDPELWILGGIMTSAFALAGFHFGRKPTASSSEAPVGMAIGGMPWENDGHDSKAADEHAKYKYHPGADPSKPAKDAPSALNSVIVPNVTLPKIQ